MRLPGLPVLPARSRAAGRALTAAALGTWALGTAAKRLPAGLTQPWARTNHAGAAVTLLEGPVWVLGAAVGCATARPPAPGLLAVVGAGVLGAVDDLVGTTSRKGLRGHIGALRRGEVTTGAVKIAGLGLIGLVSVAVSDADARRQRDRSGPRGGVREVLGGLAGAAVVAGSANAVNLFDLRPGRALKVTIASAAGLLLAGGPTSAAVALGASAGVLREDLAARSMLGDTGANAAGALVGLAVVERTGLVGRAAALTALVALTLASERVSFSAVIDRHPVLRRLDHWGRAAS